MVPPLAPPPFPPVDEVDRIAGLRDPVLRNLRITLCYHDIAAALGACTGPGANWCAFATWASRQAGGTIRREDLAAAMERAIGPSPALARVVDAAQRIARAAGARLSEAGAAEVALRALDPFAAAQRAAAAVARGNLAVFAAIAREFARFAAICLPAGRPAGAGALDTFRAGLRRGDLPHGQDRLASAFGHLYAALHAADERTRAEGLLLSNLEIGAHEQARLQPEILAALDAGFADDPRAVAREVITQAVPGFGGAVVAVAAALRWSGALESFDAAVDEFAADGRARIRVAITDRLMTLWLPHRGAVRLGRDYPGVRPAILERPANAELRALLTRLDPTPGGTLASGAADWGSLPERMHFIAELFRCEHAEPALFDPPFDAAQVAALREDRVPGGALS